MVAKAKPKPDLSYIVPELRQLAVSIDSLVLDPGNARLHPEKNLAAIQRSLARFGQRQPVVVQAKNRIVRAGNGRVVAAKALGWTHIAALLVDEDDTSATAYAIADNRSSELATWDEEALAQLLHTLAAEDSIDVEVTGFSRDEVDRLFREAFPEQAGGTGIDDTPEPPAEQAARLGDLWQLGEHMLLCGDSTKEVDVLRVMSGAKAVLAATDPPYCIDYRGERPNDSGKDWTGSYREIDIEDADSFFRSVFTNVLRVLAPAGAVYTWHAHKRQSTITRIWEELGILDHQQIVWVKPTPVFGRVYWHFQHEPCLMGWRKGEKPPHDGVHEFSSVWTVDWDGKKRVVGNEHPTEKPVELFARPIRKHTKRGDVVFEPFSGSGSQIMAAETLGRRCRAIEISPVFVDVAIRRWQEATGKEATLDGVPFSAVSEQRLGREPDA